MATMEVMGKRMMAVLPSPIPTATPETATMVVTTEAVKANR